ncbi:MAG TPA: hypothetical protein VN931_07325 [Fibrobacteria bacterium]|nr:hypothetical protein [Fibrobacteria bacterium]
MPFDRRRYARGIAAAATASILLSLLLVGGAGSHPRPTRSGPRHFLGRGSLPLSGDFAGAGKAFRDGFLAGLRSVPDSLFDWTWTWSDNGGDPSLAGSFVATDDRMRSDLVLVGLSSVATGLPACRETCLVLDDGGRHGPDSLRWDLWTPMPVQRRRLLALLRHAEPPRMLVVEATGSWTEPVFPALVDSLEGLQVILHDPGNSRWDDAVAQILDVHPRSVLFWDSPADAASLLSRRLAWPAFRSAKLWVPEGTPLPAGIQADTLRPIWQVVPGNGNPSWNRWGWRCGRALAEASRSHLCDPTGNWIRAFARVPPDSGFSTGTAGWYPGAP